MAQEVSHFEYNVLVLCTSYAQEDISVYILTHILWLLYSLIYRWERSWDEVTTCSKACNAQRRAGLKEQ
jgi:hypothetical protein